MRTPILLVLGALSMSCGTRNFGLGEGRSCEVGTLNCVCPAAGSCESGLVCQNDFCVEPGADGQSTSTHSDDTTTQDLPGPTGHGPDSSTQPEDSSAGCKSDSDCAKLAKPCHQAVCEKGECSTSIMPDLSPCADNTQCIPKGTCQAGVCQGKAARFLTEDFSKGQGQWTVTSPSTQPSLWNVGVAKPSACDDALRGEDPKEDHSESSDNMLAGTVIGGCVKGRIERSWDCLLSPKMDISRFRGKLEFSFWRHLHTPPNIVQGLEGARYRVFAVFNGNNPVLVDEGYDAGINDSDWHRSSHILDVDDNTLSVSFCFETGYGARTFAGWSIDDIRVRAKGCDPEL